MNTKISSILSIHEDCKSTAEQNTCEVVSSVFFFKVWNHWAQKQTMAVRGDANKHSHQIECRTRRVGSNCTVSIKLSGKTDLQWALPDSLITLWSCQALCKSHSLWKCYDSSHAANPISRRAIWAKILNLKMFMLRGVDSTPMHGSVLLCTMPHSLGKALLRSGYTRACTLCTICLGWLFSYNISISARVWGLWHNVNSFVYSFNSKNTEWRDCLISHTAVKRLQKAWV